MNRTPHVVANRDPETRPSRAMVAEARFVEAKAITDALVTRLGRERSELAGAADEVRVRVMRRIEVTRLELVDARAYEARVFTQWEHERRVVALRPVAGVRDDRSAPHGSLVVSTISRPSATRLRPAAQGDESRSRRQA